MKTFRLPAWLIGGLVGDLYFLVIFVWDFLSNDYGSARESFGLMTALWNLPGTIIFSASFIPASLRVSTVFQLLTIASTNFVLGAAIGLLIHRNSTASHSQDQK